MKLLNRKKENNYNIINNKELNIEFEERILQFTNLMIYISHDRSGETSSPTKKKVR